MRWVTADADHSQADRGNDPMNENHCYVRCAGDGEEVVLAFPYDAAQVGEAKAISGRRFDWGTKTKHLPVRPAAAGRGVRGRTRHQGDTAGPRTRAQRGHAGAAGADGE